MGTRNVHQLSIGALRHVSGGEAIEHPTELGEQRRNHRQRLLVR